MTFTKKSPPRRTADLFFVEMIIALLFFSLSGTIILRVFAAADMQAKKSSVGESAVLCAQSAAEAYSVYKDAEKAAEAVFGRKFALDGNGEITVNLDASCKVSADSDGITLILRESSEETASGKMSTLGMTFVYGEEEIYSLTCAAYEPYGM